MNDEEIRRLFVWLRRPIRRDPPPPWIKLNKDQIAKFNDVQARLNAKIAELEAEKMTELSKIVGISM